MPLLDVSEATPLVLTRLDYRSTNLAGISGRLLDRLESVGLLNAAARLVCDGRKYDHISPLLRDLHWLRVPQRQQRIKFRLAVLVYRCRNNTTPEYLSRDLQWAADSDSRRRQSVIINAQADASTNQTDDGRWSRFWCRSSSGLERTHANCRQPAITSSFQETLKTYLFNTE